MEEIRGRLQDTVQHVLIIKQRFSKFTEGCKCKSECICIGLRDVGVKSKDSNVAQVVDAGSAVRIEP